MKKDLFEETPKMEKTLKIMVEVNGLAFLLARLESVCLQKATEHFTSNLNLSNQWKLKAIRLAEFYDTI